MALSWLKLDDGFVIDHNSMTDCQADSTTDEPYVMVAAIDFGTTFSGYAFSFKSDPKTIKMNKSWGSNLGFQAYKTPTCVLVNSVNQFVAFGYEAEEKYATLQADDSESDDEGQSKVKQREGFHLYRNFKMMLHKSQKLTRTGPITSVDGKLTPAMGIFVMALKYLKDHLIAAVAKQVTGKVDVSLFRWVITVPAIWREEAKQFMREAAYQAGFISTKDSRQLIIALEPEAASLFCRGVQVDNFIGVEGETSPSFKAGTKYLVIDVGGGTVDLTAHEVLLSGKVKEIHKANGGDWGGIKVDANFVSLLGNILGANFIQLFQNQFPQQWLLFMVKFERVKRSVQPDGKSRINIELPYSMMSKYEEICGKPIEKAMKSSVITGVSFSNGLLILKPDVVTCLFQPVIDDITSHISHLISRSEAVASCQYFLLVGGFAESGFLQKAIMEKFTRNAKVLVPEEAQMSVIKGAVLFGHSPQEIQVRIVRSSYGTDVTETYDPKIHRQDHWCLKEDVEKCGQIFLPFVNKDTEIQVGEMFTESYVPSTASQTAMTFDIYTTELDTVGKVLYVDEEGMNKVGSFEVQMPDTAKGKDRSVKAEITFGGTEIQIKATDVESGNTAETMIDFLSG